MRFGKITLLLGANSTGKSSLLHGILAALQSDQFPLGLNANGRYVELGDFRSMSRSRTMSNKISIALRFSSHPLGEVTARGTFERSSRTGMPDVSSAEIVDPSFAIKVSRPSKFVAEWTYDREKDELLKILRKSEDAAYLLRGFANMVRQHLSESKSSRTDEARSVDPIDPFADPPPSGKFQFNRPDEFVSRFANPRYIALAPHLSVLNATLSEFRKTFNYVGSFRLEPQRSYYYVSRGDLKIERNGTNYIEQLAAWQNDNAPQLRQLKDALRQLKLLGTLRTSRLQGGSFEVRVATSHSPATYPLPDVGFGVGQLLPILVADFQLPKGGTLAISQPEIHLHPSVQADFADYVVRRSKSAKNRYILETHSEYLINRLRLLVARGAIKSEDLSVIYLTNDGSRTAMHQIEFVSDGRIMGAPDDFFQTYMVDTMDLALSAKAVS